MNLYDFDNTIYNGESTFDFFIFCMKKRPELIKYLHKLVINLAKYKICIISKEKLEKIICRNFLGVLKICPDFEQLAQEFWEKNIVRIKPFYKNMQKDDDVIISASFDFLINPVCEKLGIKNVICSKLDINSGRVIQLCFRENKPELFYDLFPGEIPENFYTDSRNDLPLMKICKNNWFVKGEKIVSVPERILK